MMYDDDKMMKTTTRMRRRMMMMKLSKWGVWNLERQNSLMWQPASKGCESKAKISTFARSFKMLSLWWSQQSMKRLKSMPSRLFFFCGGNLGVGGDIQLL